MSNVFLTREAAPISEDLWELLDKTALGVARSELAGRRLLEIDGPCGLGLKDVALSDEEVAEGVFVAATLPLTYMQRRFTLYGRDLAAYEREPSSLDLAPLVAATLELARNEDELIFQGTARTAGLTKAKGTLGVKLGEWGEVGAAQGDFISAINALDAAGFHGPYAVALSPGRYNQLLRRFETAAVSELDVIASMATGGIMKASGLRDGGVILQAGKEYAHLVIGQDLSLGFNGPLESKLEFYVAESLAVRIVVPAAVCVMTAGGKR